MVDKRMNVEKLTTILKQIVAYCETTDDQLTKSGSATKERGMHISVLQSSHNEINCTGKTINNAVQTTRKMSKRPQVKSDFFGCWWIHGRHEKSVAQFVGTCILKLDSL